MISLQLEAFLQNISFSSLFLTMLVFWIQAIFSLDLKEKIVFEKKSKAIEQPISKQRVHNTGDNLINVPKKFKKFYDKNLINELNEKKSSVVRLPLFGTLGFFIANLSLSALLLRRWILTGYFPLSNLYESLMFLSWAFTFLYFILGKVFFSSLNNKQLYLGVIIAPMAFFVNAFAQFSLPKEMQKATSLVPALQSNWLMMHVTVMMLSYAALLIGCVLSITFLVVSYLQSKALPNLYSLEQEFSSNRKLATSSVAIQESFASKVTPDCIVSSQNFANQQASMPKVFHETEFVNQLQADGRLLEKEKKLFLNTSYSIVIQNLDNLSYRILGIGFPLLTLGILSGAVWANEAWGSYWSWDPKETWAFITWLTFATYFHARIAKGWKGKEPAILASIGFFIIWICYLGVNLLGKGLHSYGWISIQ